MKKQYQENIDLSEMQQVYLKFYSVAQRLITFEVSYRINSYSSLVFKILFLYLIPLHVYTKSIAEQ